MKNGQPILSVFDGYDKTVVIPIYQRKYAWTQTQCERLFDDLEELVKSKNPTHFFGAVVGKAEDSFSWQVIDGQQRLTTVSVLLLALVHAIEAGEIECADNRLAKKILNNYLITDPYETRELRLRPVDDDREAYERLFQPTSQLIESKNVTANYHYFRQRLRATTLTAEELLEDGIANLQIMFLDLENHDDAQRIFESLNSTGISLTEGDKIRNFILMDLPSREQKRLYNDYWVPIEQKVNNRTDWFIRIYLTAQTSQWPRQDAVYEAFKRYCRNSKKAISTVLDELLAYSSYCDELSHCTTPNDKLNRLLRRANNVIGDVALPLLWPAYGDYKQGIITAEDFTSLVSIVERYTFRRFVASVATNSLNKIFATAYNDIQRLYEPGETYSNIFSFLLLRRADTSGRFPNDEEFFLGMTTKNFFNTRENRAYLFDSLENGLSNDTRDIAAGLASQDLSIEHIMPQTLSDSWKKNLGPNAEELHNKWKHRIGNLTVTAYNSSYSNSPFETKLNLKDGFRDSPYRLNNYLREQTEWGFEQIEERTNLLARQALELWPMLTTTFSMPEKVPATITLEEFIPSKNKKVSGVQFRDIHQKVKTWRQALIFVIKVLLEDHREELIRLAREETQLVTVGEEVSNLERFEQVDPALWVLVNSNTKWKITLLNTIFHYLGLNKEDLVFEFAAPQEDTNAETPKRQSRYAPLTALLPKLDAKNFSATTEEEQNSTIREFIDSFQPFANPAPLETLGGKSIEEFTRDKEDGSLSEEEILAILSLHVKSTAVFGVSLLRKVVGDGTVPRLLAALP